MEIIRRITGNAPASLGLHPAVYFYNENGKYSRFLLLGMISLITDKIRNNDGSFFKKFAQSREKVESFLINNKSLIGIVLQNLSRAQRIPKIKDLFSFLISESNDGKTLTPEGAIGHLGLRGRIVDVTAIQAAPSFTDDTKSALFLATALASAMKCPICNGYMDVQKSVQYDHILPLKSGGTGDLTNAQLVHPYCNSAVKN